MTDLSAQRGIANFNPGNLDRHEPPWNHEIRDANDPRLTSQQKWELTQGRFCVFDADHWGIRALALNLLAYQRIGLISVRAIISHWAPPADNNNTAVYIADVCKWTGFDPGETLDLHDWSTLQKLTVAIITKENGGNPYDPIDIEDGLRLAGIVKPVTISTSKTATATATGTCATVAETSVAVVQDSISKTVDQLAPLAGAGHAVDTIILVVKLVLAIVIVVSFGVVFYERIIRARRDTVIEVVPDPEHTEPVPMGGRLAT